MKKFEIIFVLGLLLAIAGSGIRSFGKNYSELQRDVVRIHILANSDSDEDQALKLQVRDRILEYTNGWLENCQSAEEAKKILSSRIDEINGIAQARVAECGYGYTTQSEVVDMNFDDRVYGNITMPHGYYSAVRVTIGEAEGKNWWCVMYPPLCVPAAADKQGDFDINDYSGYFTDGEIKILENCSEYEIRFKCVEIYNDIANSIKG